jgi:hypothetical protein
MRRLQWKPWCTVFLLHGLPIALFTYKRNNRAMAETKHSGCPEPVSVDDELKKHRKHQCHMDDAAYEALFSETFARLAASVRNMAAIIISGDCPSPETLSLHNTHFITALNMWDHTASLADHMMKSSDDWKKLFLSSQPSMATILESEIVQHSLEPLPNYI